MASSIVNNYSENTTKRNKKSPLIYNPHVSQTIYNIFHRA